MTLFLYELLVQPGRQRAAFAADDDAFWSVLTRYHGCQLGCPLLPWKSLSYLLLILRDPWREMSVHFLFVKATSSILLKINSPLNVKAPPPDEIWLIWTRTNMTGGGGFVATVPVTTGWAKKWGHRLMTMTSHLVNQKLFNVGYVTIPRVTH